MEAVKEEENEVWLTVFGVVVMLHCVQEEKKDLCEVPSSDSVPRGCSGVLTEPPEAHAQKTTYLHARGDLVMVSQEMLLCAFAMCGFYVQRPIHK